MRQKVLYMILAACLLLTNASDAFAKNRKKVENPEITKLKGKIENVMQKVDAQPDWLYSRLQMFWNTHGSDVFVNGETFAKVGGERAPKPTVKYNGTRGMESQYNRPRLEDMIPYDDDELGYLWLYDGVSLYPQQDVPGFRPEGNGYLYQATEENQR